MMGFSETFVQSLARAKFLAVLTGAGVSQESGVPTFRGENGLWKRYRAEELATPQAFSRDPQLVWEWYQYRRGIIGKASPNPAHYAIAELETIFPQFLLITQNVDGLHLRAGSSQIMEIHGNIFRNRCSRDGRIYTQLPDHSTTAPPRCECGAYLRPDVVWFGESIPEEALEKSFRGAQSCDAMLVVGTSAVVQPAASLPLMAKRGGALVGEINREETPISGLVDESVFGSAGEVLPELVRALRESHESGSVNR